MLWVLLLSTFLPLAWAGDVIPWQAVGGHPSRCLHTRMACACSSCVALLAACKRCQKRLAAARKKLPRARDAHGRWL